jgi:hypothetical protein
MLFPLSVPGVFRMFLADTSNCYKSHTVTARLAAAGVAARRCEVFGKILYAFLIYALILLVTPSLSAQSARLSGDNDDQQLCDYLLYTCA